MEILYVLIPVSIILVTLAIIIFGWAVKSGQYDDLEGPAHSILFDDDEDMIPDANDKPQNSTQNQSLKPDQSNPAIKEQTKPDKPDSSAK